MKKRLIIFAVIFFVLSGACWFWPNNEMSEAERRKLAQMPELSAEALLNGSFMNDFESYTLDQFPLRDQFRSLKAVTEYGLLQKKDNNNLYIKDGSVAQILYPLNENSIEYASNVFRSIYEANLKDSEGRIFVSVVPDKGYFLAEKNGYPALDYEKMFSLVDESMEYAEFIDISSALEIEDYYKTDSHWRQENLGDVMAVFGEKMGLVNASQIDEMTEVATATEDFHGVYYGQSALPLPTESIKYRTWGDISGCTAFNYELNKQVDVYQLDKLTARDPYDVFLGGAAALITVENPAAPDRELILFRDSFGSSIAPLFLADYSKVTLVDVRYMQSAMLDQFIDFHGQDVLFLYGTTMLNDSYTFK